MTALELQSIFKNTQILYPEWFLVLGVVVILLASIFKNKNKPKIPTFEITLFFLLGYLYLVSSYYPTQLLGGPLKLYYNTILLDSQSVFFKQLISISSIVLLLHIRLFKHQFDDEIYATIVAMVLGLNILCSTTNFLITYLSAEMISIIAYIWVAQSRTKLGFEAGIKYFIFGATVSAIMLFGVSYFYGITHSLDFGQYSLKMFSDQNPTLVKVLGALFLGSFIFKIGGFPFHSWLPDVYETTATPLLSFMSFAPKAAGFLLISRFITTEIADFNIFLLLVIFGSLLVGNLSALWQNNVKRLLGFSGIAQSGFILIGLLVKKDVDLFSIDFYLVSYLPITMGSFVLADFLFARTSSHLISDYAGLGQKYPVLAINAIIIMMALIGLPPTIGFSAKLLIFGSLIEQGKQLNEVLKYGLLVFGLLNMAISIYYYLRIPYQMLVVGNKTNASTETIDARMVFITYISFILIIAFFFSEYISRYISAVLD